MMKRISRYAVLLALALILLSAGCNRTTSPYYDEDRINDMFYQLERAFNDHDIDAFMQYFHYDYLHKGQTRWLIEQVWQNRMGEYLLIDFQDIEIVVEGDEAIVYFTMKLQNQQETVYTLEPEANGDISYFIYDSYDWYIFGNQRYY